MFDLHPDGERFAVAAVPQAEESAKHGGLIVILNFFDDLRRIAPATTRYGLDGPIRTFANRGTLVFRRRLRLAARWHTNPAADLFVSVRLISSTDVRSDPE